MAGTIRAASGLSAHLRDGKQHLPDVPPLRQLSRSVFAVLGMNPGPFALTGTNTYLVGTGAKRILVDTGEGRPEYVGNLERAMHSLGVTGLQEIVITHWHVDHLGGLPSVIDRFGRVPVWKHMPDVQEPTFTGEGAVDPFTIWPREDFCHLADGDVMRTEGATLRALHTPGHANDHLVLVHEEDKAMFTADNVLGVGTAVIRDLGQYMNSLQIMRRAVVQGGLQIIYPAHGPVIADALGKVDEYISHRTQRLAQVEAALATSPAEGLSAYVLSRAMYREVPENLIHAAAFNTLQALRKLEGDRRARLLDPSTSAAGNCGQPVTDVHSLWLPSSPKEGPLAGSSL